MHLCLYNTYNCWFCSFQVSGNNVAMNWWRLKCQRLGNGKRWSRDLCFMKWVTSHEQRGICIAWLHSSISVMSVFVFDFRGFTFDGNSDFSSRQTASLNRSMFHFSEFPFDLSFCFSYSLCTNTSTENETWKDAIKSISQIKISLI